MFRAIKIAAIGFAALSVSGVTEAQDKSPRQRLSPSDIDAQIHGGPGVGSSGVSGIQNMALKGDPTQPGLYTILLRVPAHTTIQAHHHPDDRVATVISGNWYFGYGKRFDEKALKELSPGSFYTEPPNEPHFARTGSAPAVLQIFGYGPTGTNYEDEENDPVLKK